MLALRDLQENCKKIVTFRDCSVTCNFFTEDGKRWVEDGELRVGKNDLR